MHVAGQKAYWRPAATDAPLFPVLQEMLPEVWILVKAGFDKPDQEPLDPAVFRLFRSAVAVMESSSSANQLLPHLLALATILADLVGNDSWLKLNFPLACVATATLFINR